MCIESTLLSSRWWFQIDSTCPPLHHAEHDGSAAAAAAASASSSQAPPPPAGQEQWGVMRYSVAQQIQQRRSARQGLVTAVEESIVRRASSLLVEQDMDEAKVFARRMHASFLLFLSWVRTRVSWA